MTPSINYRPAAGDDLRLVEIDKHNLEAVARLRLGAGQDRFVASNAFSVAQGHYYDSAWFRAIYLKDRPVGFVMLHDPRRGGDPNDVTAPEEPVRDDGLFVWRFMIAAEFQGRGLGRRALELLARLARENGFPRLYLSYVEGEGGPAAFYARCGLTPTGRVLDGEIEACLDLA
ncbi:GNAT family N-acetyltransferase [Pelagibius sp. CAU 1746]|uniref:GNAT family N-acetyltransferase n=1 Tax=Pelagibius sp. CAU 1746 TaxID=3140370 RepID=UPI00325B9F9F